MAASRLIRRNLTITVFALIAMIFVMNFVMIGRTPVAAPAEKQIAAEQIEDLSADEEIPSSVTLTDAGMAA